MLGTTFIVGNIGFGALARTFERWGVSVSRFSGVTMVLFVLVQGLIAARVPLPPMAVWAAYGALCSTGILTYAVLAEHFPARGGHYPAHAHQWVWFALVVVQGLAAIEYFMLALRCAGGKWAATGNDRVCRERAAPIRLKMD
ncbi:hypothetical protein [Mycetohabitans endofungorum]|uniref:hypothetical protein n=1 Tax=Mycetohabitans endofungorum TaxID=417203 RepID=UPI002B055197|nr:hypothetical protein [Mycetohabitans endofungorum]